MLLWLIQLALAHDHSHDIHNDHRILFGASGYGLGPSYQTSALGTSNWTIGAQVGTMGGSVWGRYTPFCSSGGICSYWQAGPSFRVIETRRSQSAADEVFGSGLHDIDDLLKVYKNSQAGFGTVISSGVSSLRPSSNWGWEVALWTGWEYNPYRGDLVDDLYGISAAVVRRLGRAETASDD